jgi:hypothetical protein
VKACFVKGPRCVGKTRVVGHVVISQGGSGSVVGSIEI